MNNPYEGQDFWGFLVVLSQRLYQGILHPFSAAPLYSDEIQLMVLWLLGISTALLGSLVVLRKLSMLANALSHTILLGVILTFMTFSLFSGSSDLSEGAWLSGSELFFAAMTAALLTTFLTQLLIHRLKQTEDASIGLVFTSLFAMGVVLVTLFTRSLHLGIEAVMGNLDAISLSDLKQIGWITAVTVAAVVLGYPRWMVSTFDRKFAMSIGSKVVVIDYVLMVLLSYVAMGAFQAVGAVLFLNFLVTPLLIARLFMKRLSQVIRVAVGVSTGIALFAVALSRHLLTVYDMPLSTTGLCVTLFGVFYLVSMVFSRIRKAYCSVKMTAT